MLRIPLRYVLCCMVEGVTRDREPPAKYKFNCSCAIFDAMAMLYKVELNPSLLLGGLDTLTPARRRPLASTPAPLAPRSCLLASGQLTSGWLAGR